MPKIRGRFAPMFEELGNDPRWLLELNDFEKFIFQLVLCTIYWSNGTAPDDAKYYTRRYNLHTRPVRVRNALDTIKARFGKLIVQDRKLSLLNYRGCINEVARQRPLEVEEDKEVEVEAKRKPSAFTPPSLEEAKDYFQKLGHPLEAERFIDFYTSKGWVVGKAPMKSWQAAARNWTRGKLAVPKSKAEKSWDNVQQL